MRGPALRPIVIAAGGTGGHFFPAEALASELLARGHRIVLMTDARSGGLRSEVFANAETFVLAGAGIAGRGALRGARAMAALARGAVQARGLLGRLDAAAVVGFGGYPCVAPMLAARVLRRRPALVLHEQNAVLGRANRWLAPRADVLALGFEGTTRVPAGVATVVTGNPVRPAIRALAGLERVAPQYRLRVLVLGGSLGARVFSDVVPAAVALLAPGERARLRVVQQCRAEDLDRVGRAYEAAGVGHELSVFFPDVAARLAGCDAVIARAGASTVSELAVAGCPALLVPLPSAIDDHQARNAEAVGAPVLAQAAFTPERVADHLRAMLADPAGLVASGRRMAAHARADAAARLADLVEAHIAAKAPASADGGEPGA
ncbi:MAG: UDP-N-acetylglucosamine--N-acetylmuramyl-(pentapeptide) pyrophosphoryl-undecaprenol N-acetylglucosamine transferase [Janthinobacterium lividum]